MKIKSLIIGGLGCLGLMAGGCSDNDAKYTPAPAQEIAPAYFATADNNPSFDIDDAETTSRIVTIYRNDASEEYTATIAITSDDDLITADSQVTFGVNEKSADVTLYFDPLALGKVTPRHFTLSIEGTEDCPYYLGTIEGVITYVPWISVGPDGTVSTVRFTDDFVASIYVGQPNYTMDVEIQEHPTQKGLYRLVNPYATYPDADEETYDYSKDYYIYIHAEEPDYVWIPPFETGLDFGYGMIKATSIAGMYIEEGGNSLEDVVDAGVPMGMLVDGIISFPKNSFYTAMANYEGGEWYWYGNSNGKFRVMWPQEGPEWEQMGELNYTDGLIPPMFLEEEPYTYPVAVEHSTIDAGLYRMVNPYKAGICPYGMEYDEDVYVEIDATNPDCIVIPLQYIGLADEDMGQINMINFTYLLKMNGYDDDVIIEAGFNDTYSDGVFSFNAPESKDGPESNLMICFPDTDEEMNLYSSNYPSSLGGAGVEQIAARHIVVNGAKIANGTLKVNKRATALMPSMMKHRKVAKIK